MKTRHSPMEINAFLMFCLLKNQNTCGTIPMEPNTILNHRSIGRGGGQREGLCVVLV